MKVFPTATGDYMIPEVMSDALQVELGTFFCESLYLCDDERLYQRFLTCLSGDGRRLVRTLNGRLTEVLRRYDAEE